MKVKLGQDYIVSVDSYNHTLKKMSYENQKTGEAYKIPKESFIGYYSNMERAIKGAVLHSLGESEVETTFEGYIAEVKRLWDEIDNKGES